MTELNFTVEDVVREVRSLANQNPDFVYRPNNDSGYGGCSYLSGSEGKGCIVGQALINLGVPRASLVVVEGENAVSALQKLGITEQREYGSARTPEEQFLASTQGAQDGGRPWGEAVEAALPHLVEEVTA